MPGVFRRKEQGPVERTAAADSPGHCVSPATKGENPMNAIAPLGPVSRLLRESWRVQCVAAGMAAWQSQRTVPVRAVPGRCHSPVGSRDEYRYRSTGNHASAARCPGNLWPRRRRMPERPRTARGWPEPRCDGKEEECVKWDPRRREPFRPA